MYNSGRDFVCLNPANVCRRAQPTRDLQEMKVLQESKSRRKKRSYHCQVCSTGYSSETDMEVHKASHKDPDNFDFVRNPESTACRACGQEMNDPQQLLEHLKVVHLLSDATSRRVKHQVFVCDACHRLFFSKPMLALHLRRHRLLRLARYDCPKCAAPLADKNVAQHLERHLAGRVGTCPICFSIFVTKTEMLRHVRAAHRPRTDCSSCGYHAGSHALYLAHLDNSHPLEGGGEGADPPRGGGEEGGAWDKSFVPTSHTVPPQYRYLPPIPINGVPLTGMASLCVLCQELTGLSRAERAAHAASCRPRPPPPRAARRCRCGEAFRSNILLRHHIFRTPGDHGLMKEDSG